MFSFHFYAAVLLITAAGTLATQFVLVGAAHVGRRFPGQAIDTWSSLLILAAWATYLFLASRRVFRQSIGPTLLKTALLTAWVMAALSAYRFVLFLTTFYTT